MISETGKYQSDLVKQVDEVVDTHTGWSTLAQALDVQAYSFHDKYYDQPTTTSKPFRPMFLAVLWAYVEEQAPSSAANYFDERPELAAAFRVQSNRDT